MHDWASYTGPTTGYAEQVYFSTGRPDASGWAKCLLTSRDQERGVALHYRPETLPYFSQWKNTVAQSDGYVTGLEPATGFPNPRSFEEAHGRMVELAPGETREFTLAIEATRSPARIAELQREIAAAAGQAAATSPFESTWCMGQS